MRPYSPHTLPCLSPSEDPGIRGKVGNEQGSSFVDIMALGLLVAMCARHCYDFYVHFKERETEAWQGQSGFSSEA